MNKSYLNRFNANALIVLTAGMALASYKAPGADRFWTNSAATASYTNTTWTGGVVPGANDNAINDNGTNHVVQINVGDPDWTVGQIRAGNSAGNGSFEQNGQTIAAQGTNYNGSIPTEFRTPFRLGVVAGQTGVYTMNGGTLNYGSGELHVGELGTGVMNVNGGTVVGTGQFRVNNGGIAAPNPAVINATAGHGPYLGDYTYFEQGYSPANPTKGLPPAGSTIFSVTQGDHSYTLAPSYTNNNAVILDTAVPTATITLTTPAPLTGLSFMGSAGNGPVTNICVVHFASGSPETNLVIIADWFGAGNEVLNVEGRCNGLGLDLQFPGTAGGNPVGNAPYLLSTDIALVNTANVTSIDLTYAGGNGNSFATATVMAVSGQAFAFGTFDPLAISGYNADVVIEATAPSPNVSSAITDVLNQSGGTMNISNQTFVGYIGNGIYNLSGGTNNCNDWIVIGRTGGSGALNMSGGVINHTSGGQPAMVIASRDGAANSRGTFNLSGGTVNCNSEYWVGQDVGSLGTNIISGNSTMLNVNSWVAIGRSGGNGTVYLNSGTFNKTTSGNTGNFIVADNSVGRFYQAGGTNFIAGGDLWIGQGTGNGGGNGEYWLSNGVVTINDGWLAVGRDGATGTLNISGGSMTKQGGGNISIAHGSPSSATINQTGGSFTCASGETYLGEDNGTATWTLSGGSATFGFLQIARNGNVVSATFNLDGGTLTANEVAGGSGPSTISLNGGTLKAGANTTALLHGVQNAYVGSGGAIIDTAGFNATASQTLTYNGGGLTKLGAGTLTLSGTNTYIGNTVGAGTLLVPTYATGGGDVTVSNGAGFGVTVAAFDGQFAAQNVTMLGSATTLNFNYGPVFCSTNNAPLYAASALTINGTVTVNISQNLPVAGQFPLIKYGSLGGSGSLVLGSLPSYILAANLVTNGANNSIDLVVSSVTVLPRWEGLAGGNWDINVTTNWVQAGTSIGIKYQDGNPVLFNDQAQGTTNVNLTTTVSPSSLVVTNNSLNYTIAGAGKISGAVGITKQGNATLTIANTGGNNNTGPTVISGGTVAVSQLANGGSPSAIGASSSDATNLVLNSGTLQYSGTPVSVDRGYLLQGSGGGITTVSNLTLSGVVAADNGTTMTKTGPARLAYTTVGINNLAGGPYRIQDGSVLFDGSAGVQTNNISAALNLNGTVGATVRITNTVLNCGDIYVGNEGSTKFGNVIIENGAVIKDNSWFILDNGTATINGGEITVPGRLFVGGDQPYGTGILNINGGTIHKPGDYFAVGNGGWNGSGARTGIVNQVSGTVAGDGGEMWIGDSGNAGGNVSYGEYNLSGGSVTVNNWLGVGRDGCRGTFNLSGTGVLNKTGGGDMVIGRGTDNTIGTFNMSGGTLNKSSGNPLIVGQNSGHALFNQTGGTLTVDSEYWVAVDSNTTDATNNIIGTNSVCIFNNWLSLGRNGHAVVNFSDGATINQGATSGNFIIGDGGQCEFYMSGSNSKITMNREFWIGQGGSGNGTLYMTNGTVTIGTWTAIGRGGTAVLNMMGGQITKVADPSSSFILGSGGSGTINQTGGGITNIIGETWLGENGTSIYNLDGGSFAGGYVQLARNGSSVSTLNLNVGTIAATELAGGGGNCTINFNGALTVARANNANFLHDIDAANVQSGGCKVDTAGFTIGFNQALVDAGGGGLTKLGAGTLNLNGANTYSGLTVVSNGLIGGTGSLAGSLFVLSGAGVAPGASIGTLTVAGSTTLSAGTTNVFEVNALAGSSDQLAVSGGLTYGGTLVLKNLGGQLTNNQVFTLFPTPGTGSFSGGVQSITPGQTVTWDTTQLAVNGTVRVASVVAAPVSLTSSVSSGNLTLNWSQTGWTLQQQTNALSIGLSTNWVTVPGSSTTNQVTLPISPANPSAFFRLVF